MPLLLMLLLVTKVTDSVVLIKHSHCILFFFPPFCYITTTNLNGFYEVVQIRQSHASFKHCLYIVQHVLVFSLPGSKPCRTTLLMQYLGVCFYQLSTSTNRCFCSFLFAKQLKFGEPGLTMNINFQILTMFPSIFIHLFLVWLYAC